MTSDMIVKVISGVISTLGFAILFKLKPKHLPFSMLCGLVSCLIYFPLYKELNSMFISNFFAAFATALTAEILAIICKTPTTVFLITGCITLVPGSMLFYGMTNLLEQNYSEAANYLFMTLNVGVAIGGGIIASSLVRVLIKYTIIQYRKYKMKKEQK